MRPARLFLIVACLVELALIGPNIQAELEIGTGVHVLVVRSVLTVARLSPFLAGCLGRATGSFGQRVQTQFELCSAAACGTTCTSAEPSRGIATALAGWYLIVTPVHDMLGDDTTDEKLVVTVTRNENPEPVVPFAVIMVANVVLFLCDALMLPLAPLMRRAEEPVPEPEPVRAETFTYGEEDEEAHQPKFPPTCVVCLADFVAGETVAQLPCGHVFHNQCISEWLNQHNTCPMRCEGRVLPPLATGAGDESHVAADHERENSSGEDHASESEEGVSSSSSGRVVRATSASPETLREIRV